jgi:transcriptional regulator with XRE-family HTH domain
MNLDEAMGKALKEMRLATGLPQEAIGASQSFVSDVERGKKSVTIGRLEAFAHSVKVQPATLLIKASLIQNPELSIDELFTRIRNELTS